MTSAPTLGGMSPAAGDLPHTQVTALIRADGRPQPEFRERLRVIPSFRNALSIVGLYLQSGLLLAAAVWSPYTWPVVFLLIGRAHAQFASLMHEAAHRLLFANRRANDFVGRWFLGFPAFTSTDAYRRVHMAHHREEFGPDEPDMALYANYPISKASLRRKLGRDATGRTGIKLLRAQLRGLRSPDVRVRNTQIKIWSLQLALAATGVAFGVWWLYPLFWLLPFLTAWRVINRLRSIAEHGGMSASKDRRITTHSVRQNLWSRTFLAPFNIGWHLAHHVDSGVPFRHLPEFHQALHAAGYVDTALEYRNYRTLWTKLATG
jgi:fatty acid desaturase